ncbi:MAG: DUF6438 domain-containing protein [Anaerolineae bacterium]
MGLRSGWQEMVIASILLFLLIGCNSDVVLPAAIATPAPTPVPPTPTVAWKQLKITLDWNPGLATGPGYDLMVNGDGMVVFNRKPRFGMTNSITTTITPDQVQALVTAFQEADYFSLADYYSEIAYTDWPIVTTSWAIDGRSKTIVHYIADQSTPKKLTELENKINAIIGTSQWIKP